MGQLGHSGHDVSDRVYLGFGGFHVSSDVDKPALDFGAGLFQADVLGQRRPAHGDQHILRRKALGLAGFIPKDHCGSAGIFLHRFHFCFAENTNAALAKSLLQFR